MAVVQEEEVDGSASELDGCVVMQEGREEVDGSDENLAIASDFCIAQVFDILSTDVLIAHCDAELLVPRSVCVLWAQRRARSCLACTLPLVSFRLIPFHRRLQSRDGRLAGGRR